MTLDTLVGRRPGLLTAVVDDDLVMLDPHASLYFGLDSIGRRVWQLLEKPQSVSDLCLTLEREFGVDAKTCEADVLAFVEQLAAAQLVEISPRAVTGDRHLPGSEAGNAARGSDQPDSTGLRPGECRSRS